MSMLEPEDIAIWEEKQKTNKKWQVETIETTSFDEKGIEENVWQGYAVTKIDEPENYCFECRDADAADKLCEFLNEECITDNDLAVDAFVLDNCIEWSNLITELSKKEIELYRKKESYNLKSEKILEDARKLKEETNEDIIKKTYGGNNDKTRAKFVKDSLVKEAREIKNLEFKINYISKRISFLKELVSVKTALIEVKKE